MVAKVAYTPFEIANEGPSVDLKGLFEVISKQKLLILLIVSLCLGGALLYIFNTKPLYTAETRILIDPLKAEVFSDLRSADDLRFNKAMIESQVEVIRSRAVAVSVLKAVGNEEFLQAEKSGDLAMQDDIIENTIDALTVSRVGETYVISLKYTGESPELAARYANEFAAAYLSSEVSALQDISAGAVDSMRHRLSDLRRQMTDARMRVQAFQTDNNLYEVDGRMISDEQIRRLNDELSSAKNNVAAAKAQLDFSRRVVEQKDVSAAVAAAFDNDVINNIRAEYLNSKKRLAELKRTLGSSHQAVQRMQHEVKEYEKIVQDEMRRMMQNDANKLDVAQARAKELDTQLNEYLQRRALINEKKSELQGLENEAAVYEALYTSYLDKMQQTSQKAALPITDSRIIAVATPPSDKSHPKPLLILAAALVLGTGASVVVGLYRGLTNEVITSAADAERMRFRFLGVFPFITFIDRRKNRRRVEKGEFRFDSPVYSASINNALSLHADTVRRIRASLDAVCEEAGNPADCSVLLGVVSCHSGEGKTTLASNIALSLAKSQCKTLLIDGDVKRSKIVNNLFVESPMGLGNILFDEIDESMAVVTEARTGLAILTNIGKDPSETMTMYHKDKLKKLLSGLRNKYRYIVVDLPPLLDSSDVFILKEQLDRYLIVVETGRTEMSELTGALEKNEIPAQQVLGVVLNKARD